MATFLLATVIIAVLLAGMAIGVILQNKPIKGTCGGLNQMNGGSCDICGGDPNKCDSDDTANKPKPTQGKALGYDAFKNG